MKMKMTYVKKLIALFTVTMNSIIAANIFYTFKNENIIFLIVCCYSLILISLIITDFKKIKVGNLIELEKESKDDNKE